MLIQNARLVDERMRDVRVADETIATVAERLEPDGDERVVPAAGRHLLPGMIDAHVHFREPGDSHKETWESGSKSAAAGGVTTAVDQPNTDPPTVEGEAFDAKRERASATLVDFGINGGVTAEWDPDSLFDRPLFALGEVFLADSTGDMGIDEAQFVAALEQARARDVPVTVHAEDATEFDESARAREDADAWSAYRRADAEIAAVRRACALAAERDTSVHIAHASTPAGIDAAASAGMTCEVTPHHMLLSRADLDELGTHGRMNPPLRRERRRQGVYERVADGTVDIVATDHAPHTRAEKDASIWAAPSGVPGVETALPLLLAEVRAENLTLNRVRDLTARNPAALFGLPRKGRVAEGRDADLVLVDLTESEQIDGDDLHTDCEWTPFEGQEAVFPDLTLCRGAVVYRREDDEFGQQEGQNVRAGDAS